MQYNQEYSCVYMQCTYGYVTYIGTVYVHYFKLYMYVLTFKIRELLIFVLCVTDVY